SGGPRRRNLTIGRNTDQQTARAARWHRTARPGPTEPIGRIGMSTQHFTAGEPLTAAQAALEELTQQLAIKCTAAHYLIADLEIALRQAGIKAEADARIVERVRMLRRLCEDDGCPEGFEPPTVEQIGERVRDWRDVFEN